MSDDLSIRDAKEAFEKPVNTTIYIWFITHYSEIPELIKSLEAREISYCTIH